MRYVVAIAEHGALSKAASQVFVAQSALSFQLAQLEAELGVSLFLRTRRGVELTEPGKAFLAHAQAILRQVEDARASVHSTGGEPTGKVVFGIPHSVSNALALPLLQAVRQQLPQVELELTEELTGNLIAQLRTGLLNLAVLFDDGHLAEFLHQRVLTERLSLIALAKPDGPRTPASITFKKALEQPLILPAAPHGVRPIIEAAARQKGLCTARSGGGHQFHQHFAHGLVGRHGTDSVAGHAHAGRSGCGPLAGPRRDVTGADAGHSVVCFSPHPTVWRSCSGGALDRGTGAAFVRRRHLEGRLPRCAR